MDKKLKFFGEVLVRFGNQYHAQSLQCRKILLDEKTDGSLLG